MLEVRHTLNHFYGRKLSSSHTHQKTWLIQLYCFSVINRAVQIYISPRADCPQFIPLCQLRAGTTKTKYSASLQENWSTINPMMMLRERTRNTSLIPKISFWEWTCMKMNETSIQPPPLQQPAYTAQSSATHQREKARFHPHTPAHWTVFLYKTKHAVTVQSGKRNYFGKILKNCT